MKNIIQNIPKKRGFTTPYGKFSAINLSDLERSFAAGELVTKESLFAKGMVSRSKKGVKLLAKGEISKVLTVKVQAASAAAKKAIEEKGGKLEIVM